VDVTLGFISCHVLVSPQASFVSHLFKTLRCSHFCRLMACPYAPQLLAHVLPTAPTRSATSAAPPHIESDPAARLQLSCLAAQFLLRGPALGMHHFVLLANQGIHPHVAHQWLRDHCQVKRENLY
jgi:hypothetical protein